MSRVAKKPVILPKGVQVSVDGNRISVKGGKGAIESPLHPQVKVQVADSQVMIEPAAESADAMAGTTRALLQNMVTGVSEGFEKKLEIVGVGYRAQAKGKVLSLTLGFSHPVEHPVPEGITVETPTQTEILVKGIDKQKVGQVAADIRSYRPPEPYKGKGVRYAGEHIIRKEAKKK
ncbi:MAG: 50S ribosomal protein L6 [Pseudomonadota bacterium]|uniref:50S ribosomal protein L6 n=1 Tax=Thermithiobacillus tepidarius TaxID=929 RepID=UPI0004079B6E|nr:50S ribosomal protein L6 [Thermithiobacillus tepidarius]